jgi:hypothetical protein
LDNKVLLAVKVFKVRLALLAHKGYKVVKAFRVLLDL